MATNNGILNCDVDGKVFISYSDKDLDVVRKIQSTLNEKRVATFVAADDAEGGRPIIDTLVNAVYKSRKTIFLVTPHAMKSSWFAFETILSLEWSQELGRVCGIILLHGVEEKQLPDFALFQSMPKFTLTFDGRNWEKNQVKEVIQKIQEEEKVIERALPVGNLAHAQAWSHFFGYHNIIHEYLADRIKASTWYKENPRNFPIVVYEIVPHSCNNEVFRDDIEKVGSLDPIEVNKSGNERSYILNVYRILDRKSTYYCVAQCPNVLSAIQKMREDHSIDMDENHKRMQVARFIFTMNAILHHNTSEKCHGQSRMLELDDSEQGVKAKDVLLDAIKKDIEVPSKTQLKKPFKTTKRDPKDTTKMYDTAIICSEHDDKKASEITEYLESRDVKVFELLPGNSISEGIRKASRKCHWLILIITESGLQDNSFNFMTFQLLHECVETKNLKIIPVVDRLTSARIPDLLRWVTYVDMRTGGYEERIYRALTGDNIPLALDASLIPAGNLGYGLAWGYVLNYMKIILAQFKDPVREGLARLGRLDCPQRLYLLVPFSCRCSGLISETLDYIKHYSSFCETSDNQGGANIIKSLDIYSITDDDNIAPKTHYFIGQYPAPIQCLREMNDSRIAGLNPDSMKREVERFCDTFNSIMEAVQKESRTKYEMIKFDDNVKEDLRRRLIPILRRDAVVNKT